MSCNEAIEWAIHAEDVAGARTKSKTPREPKSIKPMKKYRTNGAIGALLDEYERAVGELQALIQTVTPAQLVAIADPHTNNPDCRSIQTVLSHVVRAGYAYANYIRSHQGEQPVPKAGEILDFVATSSAGEALTAMFQYTEKVFIDYPELPLEVFPEDQKILVRWGQRYDVEQLMEHAIVHILRHRRQIERFLANFVLKN